jgi:hypothetical protein
MFAAEKGEGDLRGRGLGVAGKRSATSGGSKMEREKGVKEKKKRPSS